TTSPIEDAFGENKDLPKNSEGKSTSEKSLGITLFVIFIVGFLLPMIFSPNALTMLLPIIVGIGGWYLLHKRRPNAPAGLLATPQPVTEDEHIDLSMFEPVDGYPFPQGRTTPPSWDPLAAAPDTWHLPDPEPVADTPPKKEKKKRRWGRVLGIIVSVIAVWGLIIGGIMLAFGAVAGTVNNRRTIRYAQRALRRPHRPRVGPGPRHRPENPDGTAPHQPIFRALPIRCVGTARLSQRRVAHPGDQRVSRIRHQCPTDHSGFLALRCTIGRSAGYDVQFCVPLRTADA